MNPNDPKPPAKAEKPEKAKISDADIAAKVRAGLTRAQAIEVLEAQLAHDAALAKAKAK